MPDFTTIAAALTSIKTATDIVKFLKDSDTSIQQAEMKLKLADLLNSLADAKIELVEIQETLAIKDKKITELEDAFQDKDSLVRNFDAYFKVDENGNPTGVAYCLRCWETDHKQRQLVKNSKDLHVRECTSCGHRYDHMRVNDIRPA